MKKIIIGITLLLLLYLPNVKASTGITGYTCLNGENTQACTEVIKGTELIGNNNERFIVMKVVNDTAYLMTKYLLIDDEVNGGYKQASSATTGKTVAYGSSFTVNTGGTFAGDLALSYINSINTVSAPATAVNNPTTTGKNGIPSLTLMCEYSGTCGTVSNEGLYTKPYTIVQTGSGLTGNILLGDTSTAPYGYWTSSACYDGYWWSVRSVGEFGNDDYDHGAIYIGVRPVFTISTSSIATLKSILSGENQIYTKLSNALTAIRVDATYTLLDKVYVNNNEVASTNYNITEGSTIITFTNDYLDTLESGVYEVKATYTDGGVATTNLTIMESSPATGIDMNSSIVMSLLGIVAITGMVIYNKKNNLIRG